MKDIIIYIAQAGLFLSIFFLIYKIFLQSATFFRFNRIYLITGLISSFVLPLVRFSYDVPVAIPVVDTTIAPQTIIDATIQDAKPVDVWTILLIIYLSGIILFSVRNLIGYIRLAKLIKSGKAIRKDEYTLIDNEKVTSPFTAFRYIILNTAKLSPTEQDLILKHEITHVTQKHWFDLVCSQCALILQWFNPLIWLYTSSLKENHEFLADKAVLDTGCPPALYQAVLINQRFQGPVFSFANSFNYSNHLKRLTMMKKMKSSPWKRMAVVALIPALSLFFWVSATPNYVIQNPEAETVAGSASSAKPDNAAQEAGTLSIENKETEKKPVVSVVTEDSDSMTIRIVGDDPMHQEEVITVKKDGAAYMEGESKVQTYSIKTDSSSDGKITVSAFEVQNNKNKDKESAAPTKETTPIAVNDPFQDIQPLYIVDGKEVANPDNIDVNTIESVSVLKDKSAVELYGENGENGVVLIKLKRSEDNIYTYTGKVMTAGTENGISMAAVVIKGTTVGTITGNDGNFTIKTTEKNPTLIFSNPGYKKQEVKITNPTINIYLELE